MNAYTFRVGFHVKWTLPPFSVKGSTLKGKYLLPTGSKFFPLRLNPFLEGTLCAGMQTGSHIPCLKIWKPYLVYNYPLSFFVFFNNDDGLLFYVPFNII